MKLQKSHKVKDQDWDESIMPVVSITCLTFNHEDFVEEAIDSFLSQQINFKVEILIHDDASKDNTPSIIRKYEKLYPNLIKAIYQTENQYSKGNHPSIINLKRAKGKYIALCEGDDYWTDPFKLQEQVEFLENNPGYSVCVSGYTQLNEASGAKEEIIRKPAKSINSEGFSFTLEEMEKTWLTKTLTAVVRRDIYEKFDFSKYKHYRDIHFYYHLIKDKKAFYLGRNLGVYRIHEGGVDSMQNENVKKFTSYNCYRELYLHNKDGFTRKMFLKSTMDLLNFNIFNKYKNNNIDTNLRLFMEAIKLIENYKEIKMIFGVFLKKSWKNKIKEIIMF